MGWDRALSTFSPELLGHRDARYNDFIVGNTNSDPIIEIRPEMISLFSDVDRETNACKAERGYFNLCGGGAPANKYFENGDFDSTKNFCRFTKMAVVDMILAHAERRKPNKHNGNLETQIYGKV